MAQPSVRIDVHHITRVEGHGNIVVDVQNGVLKQCDLEIVEGPRFIEAMLRGRPYSEASHLTSRICGICAVGHATASLRATENALGVVPSEQTVLLRKLNFHGEMLDSHILHAYMLVAPDLLGVGSVLPLAKSAPDVVLRALRMKKLAGDLCAAICGRHTHPIAMTVGGFTHFPSTADLEQLRGRLGAAPAAAGGRPRAPPPPNPPTSPSPATPAPSARTTSGPSTWSARWPGSMSTTTGC